MTSGLKESFLAIRRGRSYVMNPADDEEIKPGDLLIVAGTSEHVGHLYDVAKELLPPVQSNSGELRRVS